MLSPEREGGKAMTEKGEAVELDTLSAAFLQQISDLPETTTVCIGKQFRIPDGWVIIGETVLHQFPGTWPNGWLIKKPEETEIVCSVSPIPSDYVTLAHVGSNACPGVWPNAWKIARLTAATDE
jgi:hypothetical protein